jgi:ABC-type transporter MlaC component
MHWRGHEGWLRIESDPSVSRRWSGPCKVCCERVESFTVLDKEGINVTSRMNRTNGAAPIEFDWHLNPTNDGYRVSNVTVSGIDMSSMQHSDLVSVIQRNSGQMQVLLAAFCEKNASNGIFR